MYDGVFSLDGDPHNGTFTVTTANGYQTLEELLVDLTAPNGQRAQGVFITVETNAARFLFPGSGIIGHSIASAGSISIKGMASVDKIRLASATAGSAATCRVTPYF
jgi:hypothetical protein